MMALPDLIARLQQVADLKPGHPLPDWMKTGDTSALISELCAEAAERLKQVNDERANTDR